MSQLKDIYVTTPVFNGERFIEQAANSVLTQSGPFRIRYHVQDGGSTDNTLPILREIQRKLDEEIWPTFCDGIYFSFSSGRDEGMYDAICKGFGAFEIPVDVPMTWLNADDVLLPHALATILGIFSRHPEIDWVTGARSVIDEQGAVVLFDPGAYPREIIAQGLGESSTYTELQQEGTFWRKRLWDKVGGLSSGLRLAGDWELWRRFAQQAELLHLPYALGSFRRHEAQQTAASERYYAEIDELIPRRERAARFDELSRRLPCLTVKWMAAGETITDEIAVKYLPETVRRNRPDLGGWPCPGGSGSFTAMAFEPGESGEAQPSFGGTPTPPISSRQAMQERDELALKLNELQSSVGWRLAKPFFLLEQHWPRVVRGAGAAVKLAWWTLTLRLPERLRFRRAARKLVASGLFDEAWYVRRNPDVVMRGSQPLVHWMSTGWREGRDPHPLFDIGWYLEQCKDAAEIDTNPVAHFLDRGASLGCDPHPAFDASFYLAKNPDVATAGENPLLHYLRRGAAEGRSPHPSFDMARYLEQHPDVAESGLNPLVHYVEAQRDAEDSTAIQSAPVIPEQQSVSKESARPKRQPTTVDALRTLVELGVPVKSVLDVGVLYGTAPLMKAFPDLRHFLFEPIDAYLDKIRSAYAALSYEFHHVALSNVGGEAWQIGISRDGSGQVTHSYLSDRPLTKEQEPLLVECESVRKARLDALLPGLGAATPFLLKIDVDGHEIPVLQGAERSLENASIVMIEAPLYRLVERAKYLEDQGLRLFDIVDLSYYSSTLWQVDLIFVSEAVVQENPRLLPMCAKTFDWKKWCSLGEGAFKDKA